MAYNKADFVADLLALAGDDMEAVYFKAKDIFKRFNTFSDEVNGLSAGTSVWPGTSLTKDDVLDLVVEVKEFVFFAETGQTEGPRDILASIARARNLSE